MFYIRLVEPAGLNGWKGKHKYICEIKCETLNVKATWNKQNNKYANAMHLVKQSNFPVLTTTEEFQVIFIVIFPYTKFAYS